MMSIDDTSARTRSFSDPAPGTVYLVGAGPGDAGLLTLRGVECLRKADLVLYDYLANPSMVEHAREGAELIRLGHHRSGRSMTPDEITATMVEAALAGRTVVRLKGGDPAVFARGADECCALRDAGIPFEVVPGVTSGLALSSYAEIPLTHHEDASAVALVTGRERAGKETSHLDYAALAAFPGTLVFYMGVKAARDWSHALVEHGRSPETPVAIVRWCSRARQQTVRCTLDTVADLVETTGLRPPALFVVGEVVDRSPCVSWFEARPLFGTCVLVAGSVGASARLRERLSEKGAEVVAQPVIRVAEPPDPDAVDAALDVVASYDWLVFTSPNGVDRLMRRLFERGGDARSMAGARLVALGAGTADRLARYHLHADLVPGGYRPVLLAREIVETSGKGARVLLVAGRERPTLTGALAAAGADVDRVVAYQTVEVEEPDPDVTQALADGEVDLIAVTSPVSARSLVRLYGSGLARARLVSMSPFTSAALRELGCEPDAEAVPPTLDGLVDAIERLRQQPAFDVEMEWPESQAALAGSGGMD